MGVRRQMGPVSNTGPTKAREVDSVRQAAAIPDVCANAMGRAGARNKYPRGVALPPGGPADAEAARFCDVAGVGGGAGGGDE